MEDTSENKPKKHICMGLLAHVDAGKTTLSESMLYLSGSIKNIGRVDNGDAFLDTFALERARGITIFSKQAEFSLGDMQVTLLDTPGHVDFSAEMERTLQVLDVAVLIISGADGVQGHTLTLWKLLKRYQIPTFLFVNKMDQPGTEREVLMQELKKRLDDNCIYFEAQSPSFLESIAMCDESLLEKYLEHGTLERTDIVKLVAERKLFPCYFGSALKLEGIKQLLRGIETYAPDRNYADVFGAKVYKIARDEQGNRLTYMKVTGGKLAVKDVLEGKEALHNAEGWSEKINQIRIYSGAKYETVNEVTAGTICAVTGLTKTYPGEGLGMEPASELPVLEPILTYQIMLPEDCNPNVMLLQLKDLEEEEPQLHIVWNEKLQEIQAQLMGEVQIEIIRSLIKERFGVTVDFGAGNIVYKETIQNTVEGVGHFEPLRHYAEVHLLLEPGERGSGLQFAIDCSEDSLDKNWQRLILTHLEEKEHKGVLVGGAVTDMKITLLAGKAHIKHTEGGDFRQATYRAIRQGLMQAENILLEPYYEYRMEIPSEVIGRAMADIEKRKGTFEAPFIEGEFSVLTGQAPVETMRDYQLEFHSYTRGHGRLLCTLKGYYPCHNTAEVMEQIGYDAMSDLENPSGSVFCAHGAGFVVNWDEVPAYMHLENRKRVNTSTNEEQELGETDRKKSSHAIRLQKESRKETARAEYGAIDKELAEIFARTYRSSEKTESFTNKKILPTTESDYVSGTMRKYKICTDDLNVCQGTQNYGTMKKREPVEEYLLIDGYNVIFAWKELAELAETNLDSARTKLMDILCNYQGYKKCNLILVFDAYRVEGHKAETLNYHNIQVVYTAEAETADMYIEKMAHAVGRKYHVTVATSDGLEQIIIRGQGCHLLSARDLKVEIEQVNAHLRTEYLQPQKKSRTYLMDNISPEVEEWLHGDE
ncbi:MAG: TetM/TetW/TetO/TetS family tetracycline resistance ribosomal protection protein [Lachnospiraceae bacterium]|nr:TetM/TetW/TetO/TetS family tetracycline resistance ribosomal protection protein [Lachnospiraceae bacterium]